MLHVEMQDHIRTQTLQIFQVWGYVAMYRLVGLEFIFLERYTVWIFTIEINKC